MTDKNTISALQERVKELEAENADYSQLVANTTRQYLELEKMLSAASTEIESLKARVRELTNNNQS